MARLKPGLTLIEMMLTMAIFMTTVLFVMPIAVDELKQEDVKAVTKTIESSLFYLQQNSYASLNDKMYGAAFFTDRVTLFIGSSLATAEETDDILIDPSISISVINITGGGNEISFPKEDIRPTNDGSITITDGSNSYRIDINSEGLINSIVL